MSYSICSRFQILLLVLVAGACDTEEQTGASVLNWYVFDERSGAFQDAAQNCGEQSGGRYRIRLTPLPSDADQQREQLVRRLAAEDRDIDIIGMDVIWTAEFAQAGWILPWPENQSASATAGMLPAAVASASYRQRLWALPYTSNAQLLWYRKDLIEAPPTSWNQLIEMAEALNIAGAFQVQGQRYEGLTVFFISLLASAGGAVLTPDATEVSLQTEPTRKVLKLLQRLATSPAADPGLAVSREDQGRLAFETGKPAFMVNYSYVWPSALQNAPQVAEHMAWARWPSVTPGRPSRVTIGGINLAVGAYSRHPASAFEAITCLTSASNQMIAAQKGGLPPTRQTLYQHPDVRKRFPMADTLLATLQDAVQRPQTPVYNDLSLAISHTLHPLSHIDPETDTLKLRAAVRRALNSEGLF
ncbi:ABC transporter substrate-binding protein [Methylomarinum sp. Ch1-1]|uniref:ABC transporter substrate-binding protein n=1 Tax=Methylomarinum roseum TaxID=3067653 RepID=A0AAU7NTG8_9GAMM|nr:ABC transporter substrate-binding protein [Methylomarinum sp. Ch1-1]MDP4519677.1 ABC transporter substrate-binding protein [Methylomarinum sp. Ch1-1]